jgi:hypothetical protein
MQLLRLQQLHVRVSNAAGPEERCLQLGHMTALRAFHVVDAGKDSALTREDKLPPNLRQLTWDWRYRGQLRTEEAPPGSMQPLLALTGLQRLRLAVCKGPATSLAASYSLQLAELSKLPRLQELALHFNSVPLDVVEAAAMYAWPALPIAELSLSSDNAVRGRHISANLLHQIGRMHGLTRLALNV